MKKEEKPEEPEKPEEVIEIKSLIKRKFRSRHKLIFTFFLLIIIIGLLVGGFQLFNYVKFLLGYDLTIRLSVDKNDIKLVNGQESEIEFSINKISNIVCNTECTYKFTDLNKNIILANGSFNPVQAITKKLVQKIRAPDQGEGQKVYAFDLTCRNKAGDICKTEEKNISRRTIITLEYALSEEQLNKKIVIESQLILAKNLLAQANQTSQKIFIQTKENNSFLISKEDSALLENTLDILSILLSESMPSWINQDYSFIDTSSPNNTLAQLKVKIDSLDTNINYSLFTYNKMIVEIFSIAKQLESIKTLNLEEKSSEKLESSIKEFNQRIFSFSKAENLSRKREVFNSLSSINMTEFKNQSIKFIYNFTEINLLNLNEIKLNLTLSNNSDLTLPEQKKICCLDNLCKYCEIQKKYPIILLHGHNFNEDISADNIINGFGAIQGKLESLGYLNAGELYLYEPKRTSPGALGTLSNPIVIRASYYFDFFGKPQGYESIKIQSQNIDTYAIRLREIIDNLKYETQSPKVIIISHSMGGLVLRRYIQIFGKESLDKIILIDSPNAGIIGSISLYCRAFGAVSECDDMNYESLFINKLNRGGFSLPKTYNIVGAGCKMDGGEGDGVVLVGNSILNETENVKNFFVNGTCSGVSFFHNNVLDINRYPEVFTIIENALK